MSVSRLVEMGSSDCGGVADSAGNDRVAEQAVWRRGRIMSFQEAFAGSMSVVWDDAGCAVPAGRENRPMVVV